MSLALLLLKKYLPMWCLNYPVQQRLEWLECGCGWHYGYFNKMSISIQQSYGFTFGQMILGAGTAQQSHLTVQKEWTLLE